MALKLSTFSNFIFFSSPYLTIASPRGCSEPFSALEAILIRYSSFTLLFNTISVTFGFPSVIVPVLSNITVFTLCADSSASPPFIKIPFSAPFPVPTIIAVGVANPNAQGQAITSTDINIVSTNTISFPPIKNHNNDATTAIAITIGTKYPDTVSASLAIGAFVPCASSTNFIIWARAVSPPIFSALNLITPFLLILAPVTLLPTFFSTGILSPVSIDSSTDVYPSITTPSTGILVPGFTNSISPISTSSIGVSTSLPSTNTIAVLGCSPISFLIASDVFPFDFDSKYLPSKISAIIIPALS